MKQRSFVNIPNAEDFVYFSFFCPKMGKIQIVIDIATKIRYSLLDNMNWPEFGRFKKIKRKRLRFSAWDLQEPRAGSGRIFLRTDGLAREFRQAVCPRAGRGPDKFPLGLRDGLVPGEASGAAGMPEDLNAILAV